MALKIYWTKRAEKSFENIIDFLLEEWNEKVAENFTKKVFDFLNILSEFLEIGSIENSEKEIRGFNIIKQVILFYRVKENKIILLKFFNNRQNPKKKEF